MGMTCRSWLIACLLIAPGAGAAATTSSLPDQRIAIPLIHGAPRIDGRLGEDEWRSAAMLTGFIGLATKEYFHRQGHVWICWDAKGLYMAYRAPFPAGRQGEAHGALLASVRKRDGRVYADDCVELYLAPSDPDRYIHFIGNSIGAIMDRRSGDVDWRGDWQFANQVDHEAGLWTLELAATFDSLGVAAPQPGDEWHLNVARTWAGTEKANTSLTGEYRKLLARVVFSDTGLAVRELSWGRLPAGQVAADIAVVNVSERPGQLECGYALVTGGGEELSRKTATLRPEAGSTERFRTAMRLDDPGQYAVRLTVREPHGGSVVCDRTLPFAVYRPVGLRPFYVLKTRRLGVLVDLSKMPLDPVAAKATVVLSVAAGDEELETLARRPVRAKQFPLYFNLPESRLSGLLTVTCRLQADKQSFRESVSYRIPPVPEWAGKYDVPEGFVPHPWTPLRIESGPTAVCWGRRYTFGHSPLPQQIRVGTKELLSAPASLSVEAAHGELTWTDAPVRVLSQSPAKVVLEKSANAGPLSVQVQTTVEFDGFMWSTVTIDPTRSVEVGKVRFELPIRSECVRFFHVDGKWGEKLYGPVEKRAAFPALADERHYYWLGDDDVGLCWLTDTFVQWQDGGGRAPRTGFEKTGGAYVGFLDPWCTSGTMSEALTVSFGLQATPTRPPYPRRIRGLTTYNQPPDKLSLPVATNAETILMMSLKGKQESGVSPPICFSPQCAVDLAWQLMVL